MWKAEKESCVWKDSCGHRDAAAEKGQARPAVDICIHIESGISLRLDYEYLNKQ